MELKQKKLIVKYAKIVISLVQMEKNVIIVKMKLGLDVKDVDLKLDLKW